MTLSGKKCPVPSSAGLTSSGTRVVIATGVGEFRDSWRHSLRDAFVVGAAEGRESFARLLAEMQPAVVVVDLGLPGLDGVPGLDLIRQLCPEARTIALTECESEHEGVEALRAGAKGYFTRSIDAVALRKAVGVVAGGEMWAKRALVAALVADLIGNARGAQEGVGTPDHRLECLTHRQREVAHAIARGASNKEIAIQLNVTERTVKAHVTEMFRNVGVFDRMHLALLLNNVTDTVFDSPQLRSASPPPPSGRSTGRRRNGVRRGATGRSD